MLPASSRVRHRAEFALAATGRRVRASSLVIQLAHDPTAAQPRVGVIVPRSVGGAVVRNRVRRQLRHLIRASLTALPPTAVVVIRATPRAGTLPSRVLAEQLCEALPRALAVVGS